jgi:hypothetical protein
MDKNKNESFVKSFNWKRSLITIFLMLITAVAVGGALWWVMERNASDMKEATDKSIEELSNQVANYKEAYESKKSEETEEPDTSTSSTTATTGTSVESLKQFCTAEASAGAIINPVTVVANANGTYGNCGISDASGTGGGFLIAKKINNNWTNLWEGNGTISEALCSEQKIPSTVSGGSCNF